MKFLNVCGVKQMFFNKFGDAGKQELHFMKRKYGNIKDPKQGSRPHLLFQNQSSSLFYAVPSTSKINQKREQKISNEAHFYIFYTKFEMSNNNKKIKKCVFEFKNAFPISKEYLLKYKISYKDKGNYQ